MLHVAVNPLFHSTSVTATVSGYFVPRARARSPGENGPLDLVVVKHNILSLYSVVELSSAGSSNAAGDTSLALVTEMTLSAPPVSAVAFRPSRATDHAADTDFLAILLDDIHLSIVRYDPFLRQFETVSLVQLDDRALTTEPTPHERALLRVDPTGRLLAVLSRRRHLYLIPVSIAGEDDVGAVAVGRVAGGDDTLRTAAAAVVDEWGDEAEYAEAEKEDANEAPVEVESHATVASTEFFTQTSGLTIGPISAFLITDVVQKSLHYMRDIHFVLSPGEPMLALLYEKQPTWAGFAKRLEWRTKTVESRALSCSVAWVQVSASASSTLQKLLLVGDIDEIPYSTTHMLPLKGIQRTPAGVVCFSRHALIHVTMKRGFGAYFNNHGKEECEARKSATMTYQKVSWGDPRLEQSLSLRRVNTSFAGAQAAALGQHYSPMAATGTAGSKSASLPPQGSSTSDETGELFVVTEKDGTLFTVQFSTDGAVVNGVSLTMLGAACEPSSVTCLQPVVRDGKAAGRALMFVGSAYGDSRLLQVQPRAHNPMDKVKLLDTMAGLGQIVDADVVDCTTARTTAAEAEGDDAAGARSKEAASPYAELVKAMSLDAMPEMSAYEKREVMDLVTCCGKGRSGALQVCRKSLRGNLLRRETVNAVSVFFLPRSAPKRPREAETERGAANECENPAADQIARRGSNAPLLVISGSSFTLVFTVRGEGLHQMSDSAFSTTGRTLLSCTLAASQAILQVTESELRVISDDGRRLVARHPFRVAADGGEDGAAPSYVSATGTSITVCEELGLVLLLLSDHTIRTYSLQGTGGSGDGDDDNGAVVPPLLHGVAAAAGWDGCDGGAAARQLLVFFRDHSVKLFSLSNLLAHGGGRADPAVFPDMGHMPPFCAVATAESGAAPSVDRPSREPLPTVTHAEIADFSSPATSGGASPTYLFVIVSIGELHVYKVIPPDGFGPLRLSKVHQHFLDGQGEREVMETIQQRRQRLKKTELLEIEQDTIAMRNCSQRIVSFANVSGHAGVYICGRRPVFLLSIRGSGGVRGGHTLQMYRHQSHGAVRGFSPFSSRRSPNGYVFCCEGFVDFATMNMQCQPSSLPWLTRKVPLGATPHHVVYDPPSRCCFVVTSEEVPFRPTKAPFDVQLRAIEAEDDGPVVLVADKQETTLPAVSPAEGIPVPMVSRYSIRLTSVLDWSTIDTLELEENEQVMCTQLIALNTSPIGGRSGAGAHRSGTHRRPGSSFGGHGPNAGRDDSVGDLGEEEDGSRRGSGFTVDTAPVCAVATAFPLGEGVTCRGRLLLLTVGHRRGRQCIQVFHSEPVRGPVTALASIQGHVAAAVGATIKLFYYDWSTRKLVVGAFVYADVFVTRMTAFKDYLVFGDLYQSCSMARFSAENHTLTILSRDRNAVSVVECGMMYHAKAFAVLVTDAERNLMVMGYTPRILDDTQTSRDRQGADGEAASGPLGDGALAGAGGVDGDPANETAPSHSGGARRKLLETRFTIDGEYRMPGGSITKLLRFASLISEASCASLYVTNYGEIGAIVPLSEQANRTAQWAVRRLQTDMPHPAGLTQRLFTGFNQDDPKNALQGKERLVSAGLLKAYAHLDYRAQSVVASSAYTQRQRVANVAVIVEEESDSLF